MAAKPKTRSIPSKSAPFGFEVTDAILSEGVRTDLAEVAVDLSGGSDTTVAEAGLKAAADAQYSVRLELYITTPSEPAQNVSKQYTNAEVLSQRH